MSRVIVICLMLSNLGVGAAEPNVSVEIAAKLDHANAKPFLARDEQAGGKRTRMRLDVFSADPLELPLVLRVKTGRAVKADDRLLFACRDVYSGRVLRHTRLVPAALAPDTQATWAATVTREHLKLAPSAYHLVIDLQRDGESLAAGHVGSMFFYLAQPDESLRLITGNYQMAFIDFMMDPETGAATNHVPQPPALPSISMLGC